MTLRRRSLFAAGLGALCTGSGGVAHAALGGRFHALSLDSTRMARPLHATVWTPPGYDPSEGPLPSLMLLHGARGNERSWPLALRFWSAVEAKLEAELIPRFIAICPGHFAGWWVDGPDGPMEQALIEDLLPAVGARFPLLEDRTGRAVAGISAGGFGALRLALRHPDRFGAATLWAPAIYVNGPPERSAARIDSPFQGPDGLFSRAAWDRLNWPALLPGYVAQKQRVPLFIAAGDHDPLNIAYESARLFATIWPEQPQECELRVVDGDHSDRVWEVTCSDALGFMFAHLERQAARPPD